MNSCSNLIIVTTGPKSDFKKKIDPLKWDAFNHSNVAAHIPQDFGQNRIAGSCVQSLSSDAMSSQVLISPYSHTVPTESSQQLLQALGHVALTKSHSQAGL